MVSGRSCTPRGGPDACVIVAHDATTGEELWRRRTIPAPGEPGDETWGGVPFEERRHVGAWMVPSYDPALELVYIGTSVTSPAPKFFIGGADLAHLYHNSTLALDANSGEIRWYYQHLNDHWDLDHPYERLLVDTAVAPDPDHVSWINPRLRPGEVRQVLTGVPGKTGVVYTLDRATGEFLWATPTVTQNVISGIDGATGDVTENAEVVFGSVGQDVLACPHAVGGKDWEAGAYSPLTNTMYYPLRNVCARMMALDDDSLYQLAFRSQIAPGTDQVGTVQAISAETGEILWRHEQRAATTSLVATGGGLVFGGDVNGRFRALDQQTGEVLWEVNLGSPVTGFPITFAVDGRQYVAASTGSSISSTAHLAVTPELRPSSGKRAVRVSPCQNSNSVPRLSAEHRENPVSLSVFRFDERSVVRARSVNGLPVPAPPVVYSWGGTCWIPVAGRLRAVQIPTLRPGRHGDGRDALPGRGVPAAGAATGWPNHLAGRRTGPASVDSVGTPAVHFRSAICYRPVSMKLLAEIRVVQWQSRTVLPCRRQDRWPHACCAQNANRRLNRRGENWVASQNQRRVN